MKSRHLPHSPKLAWLVSGTPRGGAVKSSRCSDEIVRFAHDEIKSVLQPDEVGFHREAISSTEGGFHPSARTDLVEKSTLSRAQLEDKVFTPFVTP